MDAETFESQVIELLRERTRSGDEAPLRLLVAKLRRDARAMATAGPSQLASVSDAVVDEQLDMLLNRIAALAAVALFLDAGAVFAEAGGLLERVYAGGERLGADSSTGASTGAAASWWAQVMARVFAVGGLAVRTGRWTAIRTLVLRRTGVEDPLDRTWVRHALTMAARAGLSAADPNTGERERLSFVSMGARAAQRLPALRIDGEDDEEAVLNSVVQFDALATLCAREGRGVEFDSYYPTFQYWYPQRAEPALVQLIDDRARRRGLLGEVDDAALANALRALGELPTERGFLFSPWRGTGYRDRRVRQFLAAHPPV